MKKLIKRSDFTITRWKMFCQVAEIDPYQVAELEINVPDVQIYYKCPKCGSFDIEQRLFVKVNTLKFVTGVLCVGLVSDETAMEPDKYFCNDCGKHFDTPDDVELFEDPELVAKHKSFLQIP